VCLPHGKTAQFSFVAVTCVCAVPLDFVHMARWLFFLLCLFSVCCFFSTTHTIAVCIYFFVFTFCVADSWYAVRVEFFAEFLF